MDIKKVGTGMIVAFIVLSIWNDPSGTAALFSDFLGDATSFAEDALDKTIEFFRGLTE